MQFSFFSVIALVFTRVCCTLYVMLNSVLRNSLYATDSMVLFGMKGPNDGLRIPLKNPICMLNGLWFLK